MTDESHSAPPTPSTLGRYRILRRLGKGGMAEVFLARSTGAEGIEKLLVVKRVLPSFAKSARFISMFTAEAKVAVRLNHPNIVQVYGFEQVGEQFLLAMEYVDGLDLGGLIEACRSRRVRMPHAIAAFVAMEVAKGLDYAHNRRDDDGEPLEIVHRDVSPQNVLITAEGVVKIADFGVAKARRMSEEPGVIKGKVGYMAPEQARGESVDRRSDVYSLGVLLAELLVGRPIHPKGEQLVLLDQVRRGALPLPEPLGPTVPGELERIVRRATAADPEERFQSARSLAGALARHLHVQHEISDAETLERFLGEVVPLEAAPPAAPAIPPTATLGPTADRHVRENRPVVVVSGRLHMGDAAPGEDERLRGWLTRVLGDMAYKNDAALSWPDGGTMERFRFILGLGSPSLHDPLTACRLALDVGEALEGLSADRVSPLVASFGVSRGVLHTARDARGRLLDYQPADDVIEVADALAGAAEAPEVLASGEVYRLVRRVYAFGDAVRTVPVDATGAGGVREVRAHPLRGARTREERAAEAGAVGRLVGREREQDKLRAAYQRAVRTRRTVFVAVTGELGVGKTALVAATLRDLDPPARVLRTEGAFGTMEVPFAATAELVREACGIADDTDADECRRRLTRACTDLVGDPERRASVVEGLLSLLVPDGGSEATDPDPERSLRIKRAVERLVSALAEQGPVAVWVDALQWIDPPSRDVVRLMLQRTYEAPVLVVLSGRPEARVAALLDAVPQIEVGELEGDADRRELVRSGFDGAEVPEEVVHAVVERAGGNPFFVLELVDALMERDEVAIEGHGEGRRVVRRSEAPFLLPATVQGVIETRLGELGAREREAARWLAVTGPGMTAADLSALAGADLEDALEDLAARGLVERRPGDAYGFPNAVIRHVAYATSHPDDLARMHRRTAMVLREMGRKGSPAQVAYHLERSGDRVGAADAYMEAARAAERASSHGEAFRLYGRALPLLHPASIQRFWAHAAREDLLRSMGQWDARRAELAAMEPLLEVLAEGRLVATFHLRHARLAVDTGDGQAAARALEVARVRGEGDRATELETYRLEARLRRGTGRLDEALETCDRALARAGMGSEWLPWRGRTLVERACVLAHLGRSEEAAQAAAEALVLFRRLGTPREEGAALAALGGALGELGEAEDAIHALRAAVAAAAHTGDRAELPERVEALAALYEGLGRHEAAESLRGHLRIRA
jgi:eukaryotic-like serine/threonine-protein kinase